MNIMLMYPVDMVYHRKRNDESILLSIVQSAVNPTNIPKNAIILAVKQTLTNHEITEQFL